MVKINYLFISLQVLNLVISGIPSILSINPLGECAKTVLNLVISGIPSIQKLESGFNQFYKVLNLVISGIPSILEKKWKNWKDKLRF